MTSFNLFLSTAFDTRNLVMPEWVHVRRRILDPSYNHDSDIDSWIKPLYEWRLRIGQAFKQDVVNLQKLFIYPESFPKLTYFSCTLNRLPPPDLQPPPASFPFDDSEMLALGKRIEKERGFVITRMEHDEEHCFLSAEKLEQRSAEDHAMQQETTPGSRQHTWREFGRGV